jgi:hypothetical protein
VTKLASGTKPTYYIWKTEDMEAKEVEQKKLYWQSLGFRVVTFIDGHKDIHTGLKAVIHNHINS